jgi:DNA repair ATPase RecN
VPIRVRVRNFQSIEDASIVIDGLTVVTGTNNAGKSAFFRAIRGAFTNARGSDFVRHGAKHTTVDIHDMADGRKLTWKKGDKTNGYVIDGEDFPKVGQGVPPEVRSFGVSPVPVGNTELWPQIAPQITGVSFLLHEPGSVIAEAVADVERVNQLSRALKASESDRRAAKGSLKVRRKDLTTYNERRDVYAGLDEAVTGLRALEKRHVKAAKHAKATGVLVKMGERHRKARDAVEALEGLDEAREHLPHVERLTEAQEASQELAGAARLRERRGKIRGVVEGLSGLEDVDAHVPSDERMGYAEQFRKAIGVTVELTMKWEEASRDLEAAREAQEALDGIDLKEGLLDRAGKFKKAVSNAAGMKGRYVRSRDAVADLVREIQDQEGQLAALDEKLTSVLGTYEECPTCGGGLDHVH